MGKCFMSYVGRIVAVGMTKAGNPAVAYRVSSRSFPNRLAVLTKDGGSIVPARGNQKDVFTNPYISYTGLRCLEKFAVVSNGTHTDIIANKLSDGYSMRDALTHVMLSMDIEHDELNTPRIAAICDRTTNVGYLAIITQQEFLVRRFDLIPGTIYYVSTYGTKEPIVGQNMTGFLI